MQVWKSRRENKVKHSKRSFSFWSWLGDTGKILMTLQSKHAEKKNVCIFYSRGKNLGLICGDCPLYNSANIPKMQTAISGSPHLINQPVTKFKHLCIQHCMNQFYLILLLYGDRFFKRLWIKGCRAIQQCQQHPSYCGK